MAIELEAIPRRWGNSLAVIIPADVVEKQSIVENKPIRIRLENSRPQAGVLWGLAEGKITRSAQEIKNELRVGWMSATDRKQEEAWKKRTEKTKK